MSARARIAAFGALWAAVSAGALLAPGCYGRNCEGDVEVFGVDGGGEMLDPNTWISGPVDGPWLWFPRQRVWVFEVPQLGGRTPEIIIPYVSSSPEPSKTGDHVIGAGNIALIGGPWPNRVTVRNDTCSDYYLRLVLEAPPFPPEADAGVANTGEAGTADVTPNAGDDAGT